MVSQKRWKSLGKQGFLPFAACRLRVKKNIRPRAPHKHQWELLEIVGFRRVHAAWAQNGSGRRWGDNSCDGENYDFPKTMKDHCKIIHYRNVNITVNGFRPVKLGCQEKNKTSPRWISYWAFGRFLLNFLLPRGETIGILRETMIFAWSALSVSKAQYVLERCV